MAGQVRCNRLLHERPRDDDALDLVGAFVNLRDLGVAHHTLGGNSSCTHSLRAPDGVVGDGDRGVEVGLGDSRPRLKRVARWSINSPT
jgi:hypothetical protein